MQMPNRLIKESICTSDNLDRLSWFEEAFFFRLIVNCDDYGRMDARPAIIRSRLFPLKTITDTQIKQALQSLRSAAMIDLYDVDGRSFLQMRTWERHQSVRAKKSKYPAPESGLQTSEIICKQMNANVPVIQSNPNPCGIAPAHDDGDILSFVAAHQHADDLIRRYKLPDSDNSRESLLEDAEKVGFDALEDALKRASDSNSRPMLSVNYYRRFLEERPKAGGGRDDWDDCPTF
jgi:hypothetical protein